jgi:hypothetical protein
MITVSRSDSAQTQHYNIYTVDCVCLFDNISVISWRSVLLVEETGGPGENHRPVGSH